MLQTIKDYFIAVITEEGAGQPQPQGFMTREELDIKVPGQPESLYGMLRQHRSNFKTDH